jgi:hypothetical protein
MKYEKQMRMRAKYKANGKCRVCGRERFLGGKVCVKCLSVRAKLIGAKHPGKTLLMRERWARVNLWGPVDVIMEEVGCSKSAVYMRRSQERLKKAMNKVQEKYGEALRQLGPD